MHLSINYCVNLTVRQVLKKTTRNFNFHRKVIILMIKLIVTIVNRLNGYEAIQTALLYFLDLTVRKGQYHCYHFHLTDQ